jgi:hypothetical protein
VAARRARAAAGAAGGQVFDFGSPESDAPGWPTSGGV